ncbi:hypothetical protein [Candidatus Frankia nodulisporulans]|uniref:hypothetical protein n=1 Tax=Candidatus Frankia nodulisporulans TaxID=2060052 RepID=UPI0013D292B0|nr:hypothetical protein [Candidatus Frankia nodulisporulans]
MSGRRRSAGSEITRVPGQALEGADRGLASATADLAAGWVRYTPPWIAAGTLPVLAESCHLLWGGTGAAPWAAAGMALATAGLTRLTWRVSHARQLIGRIHVSLNTALSLGWVTVATITGLHRPVTDIWLLGGAAAAFAWNLRTALHGTREDDDRLRSWWRTRAEKASLPGSQMATLEVGEDRGRGRLELADGQTVNDAIAHREVVAAMAGVPASGVRIQPDPHDASVAEVTFVRRDMLREIRPYTGPSHVGGLPTDPHEIGTYEDGERLEITLAAVRGDAERGIEDKNSYHLGIGGKNGAGKSGPVLIVAGDWLCRHEALVIVIDTVKREQTWGSVQDLLTLFVAEKRQAKALIHAVLTRLVPAIAKYLGERGYSQWEPGCGIPAIFFVIEEAFDLPDESMRELVQILQRVRSLGINLSIFGQRWTFDNIPTSARSEIVPIQFGCAAGDAGYLLGELADRGGDIAEQWGANHPGRALAALPGIPEERHLIPLRVDKTPPQTLGPLVRPHYVHTEMPQLFIDAFGEVWTSRPVWPAPGTTAPQQEGWTPPMTDTSPADDDLDDDAPLDLMTDLGLEADEDPDVQPGPDDEVPPLGGFNFAPPPRPRPDSAVVRQAVVDLIRAWGPGTVFRPADIARALPEHAARSRSTISRLLVTLLDDGVLEDGGREGEYRMPTTAAGHAASPTRG